MLIQMEILCSFFITEHYSIVLIYHIFIHSSADGHLGCFHILVIVNNTANEHQDPFIFKLVFLLLSDIGPGVKLLASIVVSFLVF